MNLLFYHCTQQTKCLLEKEVIEEELKGQDKKRRRKINNLGVSKNGL
jgi:hypothetical protein